MPRNRLCRSIEKLDHGNHAMIKQRDEEGESYGRPLKDDPKVCKFHELLILNSSRTDLSPTNTDDAQLQYRKYFKMLKVVSPVC